MLLALGGADLDKERTYGKKKRGILTVAAIKSQDTRVLELLLRSEEHGGVKFNANQTDRFQRNAIFYALFRNNLKAVQMFIQIA